MYILARDLRRKEIQVKVTWTSKDFCDIFCLTTCIVGGLVGKPFGHQVLFLRSMKEANGLSYIKKERLHVNGNNLLGGMEEGCELEVNMYYQGLLQFCYKTKMYNRVENLVRGNMSSFKKGKGSYYL